MAAEKNTTQKIVDKRKRTERLVAVAVVVVFLLLALSIVLLIREKQKDSASAPDNVLTGSGSLIVNLGAEAEAAPFAVENMLPGDQATKDYLLRWKSNGVLAVSFGASLLTPADALSDALRVQVYAQEDTAPLFDGPLDALPTPLRVPTSGDQKELSLTVTVYLDVSAGNECAEKEAELRLSFWVAEEDLPFYAAKPASRPIWPIVLAVVASVIGGGLLIWLIVFLLMKRRKENGDKNADTNSEA